MRLGQIGFSYWELIFPFFRKYPVSSIDNIFVFFEYVQYKYTFSNNTTLWVPYVKPGSSLYTVLFLNERDKLYLNKQDFLVLHFCVRNLS